MGALVIGREKAGEIAVAVLAAVAAPAAVPVPAGLPFLGAALAALGLLAAARGRRLARAFAQAGNRAR
jgi:hypothetical protein